MSQTIKVAFASGTDELNDRLIARMRELFPELPLYVVSEFPSREGQWILYSPARSLRDNLGRCRAAFRGKRIRLAGVLLVPNVPYRRMRLIALLLAPRGFLAFNETLDNFMLRPWCAGVIIRNAVWRARNFVRHQLRAGGEVYTFFWRLVRPRQWRRPLARLGAALGGSAAGWLKRLRPRAAVEAAVPVFEPGISVVIPSRHGKELLERVLPGVTADLAGVPSEIIVVDNGSEDGSADFLRARYPELIIEAHPRPLAFAEAVNRGIRRARFSHVCLLNNDMVIEPGFFAALREAFDRVPDLFGATAEIFFPPGARRQETGKAVMPPRPKRVSEDFPIRCDWPVPGEDVSYVLYGSGGCTLYDHARLEQLGSFREVYQPAYVEDLDLGYRAWQRGWPTVFCAAARVTHHHRATTSRYYEPQELARCLELNYLRFLAGSVSSPRVFRRLWRDALRRLDRRALRGDEAALAALRHAWRAPLWSRPPGLPSAPQWGGPPGPPPTSL
ncbi:MAG: glycosyltransferase, partial [Acidobacteria bacterium]|nr:glycosyltransferase [Acidobacteriota bacterium]